MIATQETDACAAAPYTPSWAHALVLDIIETNLPLPELARVLEVPFEDLLASINTPEVQAEIDAYEELVRLRARLVGQTARPISIRKMLEVLETPTPRPLGRDPESDQRALHRHAELIRRTAAAIARESRALAPKPTSPRTKTRPQPNPTKNAPESITPDGSALGGTAPDGTSLDGTTPGGTALQSGVNHPDTSSHQCTEQVIAPDGAALDGSATDGTTPGGISPGGTTLQSGVHHPDNASPQATEQDFKDSAPPNTDHDVDDSALDQTDHDASSLLTSAGSTRARDHPCA